MNKSKFYISETSKRRNILQKFCIGNGIDIGYGGDAIVPSAITIDYPQGFMANTGLHPVNLGGDARSLYWFRSNVLDYVYSSHCLEDFENTKEILIEWLRVLKKDGTLILLLPDQKRYESHCKKNNTEPNGAHKIKNFSLKYIKNILKEIEWVKTIYEKDFLDDYDFAIVIEKTKESPDNQVIKEIPADYQYYKSFTESMKTSRTYKLLRRIGKFKI